MDKHVSLNSGFDSMKLLQSGLKQLGGTGLGIDSQEYDIS